MKQFALKYGISLNVIRQNNNKKTAFVMHHGMLGSARNLRPLVRGSSLN